MDNKQQKLQEQANRNFLMLALKNIAEEAAAKYQFAVIQSKSGGADLKHVVEVRRRMAITAKQYYEKVKNGTYT
jgi:hypothetical protein